MIGNTINLFAEGGNIGNTSGGNDLEIDSQAYGYGTIGARATGSFRDAGYSSREHRLCHGSARFTARHL